LRGINLKKSEFDQLNAILKRSILYSQKLLRKNRNRSDLLEWGEVIIDFCNGMIDNHEIIYDIFSRYDCEDSDVIFLPLPKEHTKVLCALPLIRAQIETVFSVVIVVRKKEEIYSEHVAGSMKKYFQRFIYLMRAKSGNPQFDEYFNKVYQPLKDFLTNKSGFHFFKPATEQELQNIENQVRSNHYSKLTKFPGPSEVLKQVKKMNDPIYKVLAHLIADYMWLSGYTHGNQLLGFSRRAILINRLRNYLKQEVTESNLYLSFLSILIVLTDLLKLYKDNFIELVKNISDGWEYMEKYSVLGQFVYEKWARSELGGILNT